MLLMPWADYQKSYRSVALQLRSKIPVGAAAWCRNRSASRRPRRSTTMPASARAPSTSSRPNACPLLLVQGSPQHEFDGPGAGWVKLADVGRPGDRGERYRLYRLGKMNTRSPTECPSWAKLAQHAESWRNVHGPRCRPAAARTSPTRGCRARRARRRRAPRPGRARAARGRRSGSRGGAASARARASTAVSTTSLTVPPSSSLIALNSAQVARRPTCSAGAGRCGR